MRILRIKKVAERLDRHRSYVYRKFATDPSFPRPVRLGPASVGILEHELDAWLERKAAERDCHAAAEDA